MHLHLEPLSKSSLLMLLLTAVGVRAAHRTHSHGLYSHILQVNACPIRPKDEFLTGTVYDGHMPLSPVEQRLKCLSYAPMGTII